MPPKKKTAKKTTPKASAKQAPPRPAPASKSSTTIKDLTEGQTVLGKKIKALEKKLNELTQDASAQLEEFQSRMEEAELAIVALRNAIENDEEGVLARVNDLEAVILGEDGEDGEAAE